MKTIKNQIFNFPVELLSSARNMNDLILSNKTFEAITMLKEQMDSYEKTAKPSPVPYNKSSGLHALFIGPPGTGKTMAAEVLANELNLELYRIDLSVVLSKYIGETEKNLHRIFTAAESLSAILFFDEADALFGKRTEVKDSHDRYANQEISYLLQQIESFRGILIVAFNEKLNPELPFFRRFNTVVEFEKPGVDERLRLWKKYIPLPVQQEVEIDLVYIAQKYELSGGSIVNLIRSIENESPVPVSGEALLKAIQRETRELDVLE